MNSHHVGRVGWVLFGGLVLAGTLCAQEPAPPVFESSAALADINRGIRAYAEENRDEAEAAFKRVLETSPSAEHRVTCHYYLGLLSLEHGLERSTAAQAAKARLGQARSDKDQAVEAEALEQERTEATAALAQFDQAQQHFEQVIRLADPSAELVNAALLLGIAQLASDYPESGKSALELSQRAAQTLQRYVTETDHGAQDRYGPFYLAVAQYRLAQDFREKHELAQEYGENLRAAKENLQRAQELAEADLRSESISQAAHDNFRAVLTYYGALLALLESDNAGARRALTTVEQQAAGTALAQNAQFIVEKLDAVEAANPRPVEIPVPKPIGPLEIDTRLRVGNWYDTNVILLGKDTQLPRHYGQQYDYQFGLSADFNISRYIAKSEAPWVGESLTLGIGGGTTNIWQPSISEFDVNRYPGRAYVNWQPIPDLSIGFQYEYSFTQLGHKPFISSNRFTPIVSKSWREPGQGKEGRELGRTDLYFTQDDRNYMDRLNDRRLNRDGTYRSAGIQQTFNLFKAREIFYMKDYLAAHEREMRLFGDDWLAFTLGYEFRDERTIGTEFDNRGNSLIWQLYVPLPYRLAFEVGGDYTWAEYSGASIFDFRRRERSDFLQRYNLGLTYTIIARGENASLRTLSMKVRAGVEMTYQDSNVVDRLGENVYEYDRAVYGLQLAVDF